MAILGPGNGTLQNGTLTNVTSIPQFLATGSKMIFEQTSAPVNWTKVTTGVNNRAMRVITGTAAPGGTVAFSTVFSTARGVSGTVAQAAAPGSVGQGAGGGTVGQRAAGGTVGGHTLSLAQIAPHSHPQDSNNYNLRGTPLSQGAANVAVQPAGASTGAVGGGGSHTHPFSGAQHNHPFTGAQHTHPFSGGQHAHPWSGTANLNVFYVDVIIATKD